jgi:glycosyltransferase involved in cell wall biosynthesis
MQNIVSYTGGKLMVVLTTCVVATHNRPNLVCDAVESLLEEPIDNLEIVVVDDGSAEDCFQQVKKTIGDKVRLLRNSISKGSSAARNRGILEASGDYITFLDDDDLNISGRIKAQLELAQEYDADFVTCTRCLYWTAWGKTVKGSVREKLRLQDMWFHNPIVSVTPLVQRDLMRSVMFDENLPPAEDYDAWFRCLQQCRRTINYSGLAICYRRTHSATITGNRKNKFRARMVFYRKHHHTMPFHVKLYFLLITGAKWLLPDPLFFWYSLLGRAFSLLKDRSKRLL